MALKRQRAGGRTALDGCRIMVVEDHADSRELLVRTLQQSGAAVTAFPTAKGAFAALPRRKPAVVVVDIGLPGEDGYAFLRRVRAHPVSGIRGVPAIALTAYATAADRAAALGAGFQEHLAKPLDPARLLEAIQSVWQPRDPD
jgi:CheY-like chemotaxis protein